MQSKASQVYTEILIRIQEGFWKPGEQILSERQLATLFSVSRVTVRNAISQLVGEGILSYQKGKLGTFVSNTSEIHHNPSGKLIGIALDNTTTAFASLLLEGIHDSLWERNYGTLYCNTYQGNGDVVEKIESFIHTGIIGLIFSPLLQPWQQETNQKIFALCKDANIPIVQIDRFVAGLEVSRVQCDNVTSMEKLMRNLIHAGVERPAVLCGIETSSTKERILGIEHACAETQIKPTYIYVDEMAFFTDEVIRYTDIESAANDFSTFDAIVGLTQILSKMASTLGKQFIKQRMVTAGVSASTWESVNQHVMIQPLYHIGYQSANLLTQHIHNDKLPKTTILIEADIVSK